MVGRGSRMSTSARQSRPVSGSTKALMMLRMSLPSSSRTIVGETFSTSTSFVVRWPPMRSEPAMRMENLPAC